MYLHIVYGALIATTLIAAVTDFRTGLIPNWLTLPALALAIALHGAFLGAPAAGLSALGAVICGATPLLFFRLGAMGGGDVKLFAALGAIAGPGLGLEIQLLSMTAAFIYGLCLMTYRGQLLHTLRNVGRVFIGIFWPPARARREGQDPPELTSLRIGAAIFAGVALAVGNRIAFGGIVP
jgi:prepilin peptidase CpaA